MHVQIEPDVIVATCEEMSCLHVFTLLASYNRKCPEWLCLYSVCFLMCVLVCFMLLFLLFQFGLTLCLID